MRSSINRNTSFLDIIFVLLIIFIIDLVLAWAVMMLWNALLPTLFSLPIISFWQSFGLMVLIDILFKNRIDYNK